MKTALSLSTFALLALSGMASAQSYEGAVQIHDCLPPVNVGTGMEMQCSVTNNGAEAMAGLSGDAIFAEPGRTVPWGRVAIRLPVPGGIEPGETRDLVLPYPDVRNLPYGEGSALRFENIEGRTLDGAILALERKASAVERKPEFPVMTQMEGVKQLEETIARCWDLTDKAEGALPAFAVEIRFTKFARIEDQAVALASPSAFDETTRARLLGDAKRALLACNGSYRSYPMPDTAEVLFTSEGAIILDLQLRD